LMAFVGGTRKATRVKSLRTLPDASPVRSQKLSKSEPRLVVPTETLTAVQSSELARHMDPSHLQAMVDQISKQQYSDTGAFFMRHSLNACNWRKVRGLRSNSYGRTIPVQIGEIATPIHELLVRDRWCHQLRGVAFSPDSCSVISLETWHIPARRK